METGHLVIDLYVHFVSDEQPTAQPEPQPSNPSWRDVLGIPKPNKYSEVRRHILERIRFDNAFRQFYRDATRADLIKLRARKGQSVSSNSIKVLLHRWKNHGRINKLSDGHWQRLT